MGLPKPEAIRILVGRSPGADGSSAGSTRSTPISSPG